MTNILRAIQWIEFSAWLEVCFKWHKVARFEDIKDLKSGN
jgi:hypothetical protein